ncbi:WD40 repeat-like protein [Lentithecium fluviatile CBS 122367]|uniref:WD40 repeat-like protein n=1 Tax=Lentithecium fluviatile CBS 122367 TaxID=1168545 RepID=A0A6G1JHY6_9PLEO|nr:WD40 repeat-like protein [Lentithecium fluviatile CBS 122367]
MACPEHGNELTSTTVHTHGMDPYATTMAHLSIAPATTTTVVTTTTTTTTKFPPMVLKPPRSLRDRDPKEFPLANARTPENIRKFLFEAGGGQASFQEADDGIDTIAEHKTLHNDLAISNGKIQTYTSFQSEPTFATPNTKRLNTMAPHPALRSISGRRKRSSSPQPPSISEAAEIASLQRRSKKPRMSIPDYKSRSIGQLGSTFTPEETDDTVPATPDTDVGGPGSFKIPRTAMSTRRSCLRSSSQQVRRQQPPPPWQLQESFGGPSHSKQCSIDQQNDSPDEHPFSTAIVDGPGIAATPPIADTDLEPVGPFAASDLSFNQAGRPTPTPLNTLSAQDASLPSPSLSPITAAATLAQQPNVDVSFRGGADDDSQDVSSLDISQGSLDERGATQAHAFSPSWTRQIDMHDARDETSLNPQLPTPSIMDVPNMLDMFDAMPEKMKTYVMFQLLRRCPKPTLHFVSSVVNPALKCDFIALLPTELSLNIISYLDVKSMCSAAQVSRKWREMIDTNEGAWKNLLDKDGYALPENELERAIEEGWGWQYPDSPDSYERDLRDTSAPVKVEYTNSPGSSGTNALFVDFEGAATRSLSTRQKRKANGKHGGPKKQRKKGPPSKMSVVSYAPSIAPQQGPFECAKQARGALPIPDIGLLSLRKMHLFKSLYQRHHLIRQSWMNVETKPKHIAFRAHARHVVTCLQFDTDKILTGSDDTNINVYDTKTGALRSRLEGHEGGVWALQYEGNTLVSGSTDRSVRVWDIEKGKCTQVFQGHTSTVRCLVILKPTKIGETLDGQPIMMPKEELIITGSRDSSLRVWKLPKPGEKSIMQSGPPANDYDNPYFIRALTGHHHSVRAIAAHGDTLVSGSYDCNVRVWKISTGEVLHRLQGHSQKVYSVVLDNDRNRCISGSMDNMVKVWSLENGNCLFTLEGHTSLVGLLDLSHQTLVSAAADSTLRIWDPETGRCKSRLCAHTGAITCFQHDGQKVISGSDRTLKMWDVKTGEFVKDLLTDLSGVWQVKFNERRCVAAVQRNSMTYIEVLDFGASRDGVPVEQRGRRIVVNSKGQETEDVEDLIQVETDAT